MKRGSELARHMTKREYFLGRTFTAMAVEALKDEKPTDKYLLKLWRPPKW